MAFTGIAALASGAAMTTATVLAAVAEIGTIMTVVGAVTGSKDLMKLGGAMALVGGVGGMVNGALGGTAAAGAAEGIEGASQAAADAYGGAAGAEASQAAGIEAMGGDASGIVGGASAAAPDLASSTMSTTTTPAQEIAQTTAPVQAPAAAPTVDTSGMPQAPTVASPQGPTGAQAPVTPMDVNPTDARLAAGTQGAPQNTGSFWNQFTTFADKNKTLLGAGMQLGGGLLKGLNDGKMWDQKMALEQDRLKQTSFGSQTASTAPRPTGIVAGARA